MPVDTEGIQTVSVPVVAAVDFACRAFAAVGVPEEDAAKAASALVDADVQGISTHGIKNLSGYVRAVRDGKVNPRPDVRANGSGGLGSESGTGGALGGLQSALVKMSADNGLGHVAAGRGMETAIELAREHGVGCVFMAQSNHFGASGYWARLAVRAGMAGFAVTNAMASIAPWGGTAPMIGNNPPAWAIPTFDDSGGGAVNGYDMPDSIHLDMALSVVAGNRLDIYARRGLPIPSGWALDKDGEPSTDARIRAKGGTFAPVAEYKGYGLALLLSLFTSVLSGGAFDDEQLSASRQPDKWPSSATNRSHWFMAFDVTRLVPREVFGQRVREIAARIRSSDRKAGVDRLHVPGDMERERARRQLSEGLSYEPFILDDLKTLAALLGIPLGL